MATKINVKAALMSAGANAGGALAAAKINDVGFVGKQKPIQRAVGKLLLGAAAVHFLAKGKKASIINDAVAGWNGIAAIELLNGIKSKNGTDATAKPISIGAIGDVDSNILGVGSVDAEYVLDSTSQADEVAGIDNVI